jgi:hypothetical protein
VRWPSDPTLILTYVDLARFPTWTADVSHCGPRLHLPPSRQRRTYMALVEAETD